MIHTAMFQKHKYIYPLSPPRSSSNYKYTVVVESLCTFHTCATRKRIIHQKMQLYRCTRRIREGIQKKKKSGRWIGTRQISFGIKTPLWRRTESTRDHRREKLEEGERETRRERNINGKGGGGVFRNRGKNTLTWRTWLLSDICIEI